MSIEYDAQLAGARPRLRRPAGRLRLFFYRHPLGAIGALIMALFVFAAVFAPLITFYDPLTTDPAVSLARPGAAHWLGCDFMGRDVYSRIVYGARISLAVGIGSTLLGSALGILIGLPSGYLGGWVDLLAQRLVDILQALPLLVLALVMAAALSSRWKSIVLTASSPDRPHRYPPPPGGGYGGSGSSRRI